VSSAISGVLENLRRQGRKALMPYITAGDPSLSFTRDMIVALGRAGADLIELGVPFVDPAGEGPIIQASVHRALANGVTLKDVLGLVRSVADEASGVPIILLSYLNPVFRFGYQNFAAAAGDAGVRGALIVDLPPEQAGEYRAALQSRTIDTVFVASPVTSAKRLEQIGRATSGICYYVSRRGVTGGRQELSGTLGEELALVRSHLDKPILVGFGIRTPEQAAVVGRLADGVIVGTAFVECIQDAGSEREARAAILDLAVRMKHALATPGTYERRLPDSSSRPS